MEQKLPYKADKNTIPNSCQDVAEVSTIAGVQEFGNLTICAIRYCFGRMTYMPSLIVELTKANWSLLTPQDRATILKDVAQAIQDGRLGMDCDKQMWLAFYDWMMEKYNETI